MKKIPKFSVVADESDVVAISLVEEPAVEESFILLSKQAEKPLMKFTKDDKNEKYLAVGAVLIPDKDIYRNVDGNEFFISFSADCIEKLAHKFMKNAYGSSCFTLDHETFGNGLSLAESWVKTTENDKSNDLGFDLPIGTWFVACKVDSIEVWESLKEEKRTGFSIESFVDLEEIINDKNTNTNMAKEKKVNLETMEINDGFWDKLKGIIAEAVGTTKEDEVVEEAVEEAKDAAEAVEETELEADETVVEEVVEDAVEEVVEEAETTEEAAENLQEVVDQLQEEVEALKAENEELKKKNQKLSKQPSAKVNVKQGAQKRNSRDVIEALYNGSYFSK